ncbi:nucleotide cyclase [Lucifera butyrica]|uniref:Nucleotide cyclase n=1 Tax=Lucifera butyrica TaxID=1351585 RepID=A0A498R9Z7_9FIRM|nr:GGDEF domain-containing protein [Lucifera butyrica]VBB05968.1 nucleotide cyclase [Lucifera butyrica]
MKRENQTSIRYGSSLDTIQFLTGRIGLIFALFVVANAMVEGTPAMVPVIVTAGLYLVFNGLLYRYAAVPNAAELLVNLILCAYMTYWGAVYSNILYYLLLGRMVLRVGQKRAGEMVLLTGLTFVAASALGRELPFAAIGMNVLFHLLSMSLLAFMALKIRLIMLQKMNADKEKAELIQEKDRNQLMALTDGLTGLYNYRAYREKVDALPQCVLLVVDIDHFKRLNDTYGHLCGDKILVILGNIIKNSLRKGDLAFRYGGEEFVIVLPAATAQLGYKVAERLRARVAETKFIQGTTYVPFTISIGMALKGPGMETQLAFEQADKALYRAKRMGRNNVQYFDNVANG